MLLSYSRGVVHDIVQLAFFLTFLQTFFLLQYIIEGILLCIHNAKSSSLMMCYMYLDRLLIRTMSCHVIKTYARQTFLYTIHRLIINLLQKVGNITVGSDILPSLPCDINKNKTISIHVHKGC